VLLLLLISVRSIILSISVSASFSFLCSGTLPHLHSFPTRRSSDLCAPRSFASWSAAARSASTPSPTRCPSACGRGSGPRCGAPRSEEHTSELQSRGHLVCRLLLAKKQKPDLVNTPSCEMISTDTEA